MEEVLGMVGDYLGVELTNERAHVQSDPFALVVEGLDITVLAAKKAEAKSAKEQLLALIAEAAPEVLAATSESAAEVPVTKKVDQANNEPFTYEELLRPPGVDAPKKKRKSGYKEPPLPASEFADDGLEEFFEDPGPTTEEEIAANRAQKGKS